MATRRRYPLPVGGMVQDVACMEGLGCAKTALVRIRCARKEIGDVAVRCGHTHDCACLLLRVAVLGASPLSARLSRPLSA
mmetsp:Transcript_41907/g.122610  ORF Transcript_41907/g.122610 Transcript_41907/m.122610 type:complete len:80 (-) Transcript_41907:145-384(-)